MVDNKNNTGKENTGNWNSGDRNSGNGNSGYGNSGYGNSGDWNSGYWNSGDWNSGDWNSGYGNSTDRSAGIFCNQEPQVISFNKPTDKSWDEIDHPHFDEFILNEWVSENDMTDEEKKNDPEFYIRGGYLKTYTYEEAWDEYWKNTSEEDRQRVLNLPNFSWDVFTSITGIENTKLEKSNPVEIQIDGAKYRLVEE